MDDIYKAAVRDGAGQGWAGLGWVGPLGAHSTHVGGRGHPTKVVGSQERAQATFSPGLQGDGGYGIPVPGCGRSEGFRVLRGAFRWVKEVTAFSIMSAPVSKCLLSVSLSSSHISLRSCLWPLDLCLSPSFSISLFLPAVPLSLCCCLPVPNPPVPAPHILLLALIIPHLPPAPWLAEDAVEGGTGV